MSKEILRASVCCAIIAVLSLACAAKEPFVGEGLQIIVRPWAVNKISADEPCWIQHGWMGNYYPGIQRDVKDEYGENWLVQAGRMTFSLTIDGEPIKLKTSRVIVPTGEPGHQTRYWEYYIQFEPFHFAPGTYHLLGVYDAVNPNNLTGILLDLPWEVEGTLVVH